MTVAILLLLSAALLMGGWSAYASRAEKRKEAEKHRPVPEILMDLILRKVLENDDTSAIALFCAYRAMTMPDRRPLVAAQAAEVDRRYGSRVPWPEELGFQVRVLLDEYYNDELARIEVGIHTFKMDRKQRRLFTEIQAGLAKKESGW